MTRSEQKAEERAWLEAALEICGIEATYVDDDRESPDFVIELEGVRIGVEVTKARAEHVASGRGALRRLKTKLRDGLDAAGHRIAIEITMHTGAATVLENNAKELNRLVDNIRTLGFEFVNDGALRWELERGILTKRGVRWIESVTLRRRASSKVPSIAHSSWSCMKVFASSSTPFLRARR